MKPTTEIHEHRFALPQPAIFVQDAMMTAEQAQMFETAWDNIIRAASEEWVAVRKQRGKKPDVDLDVHVVTLHGTLPGSQHPIRVQMAAAIEIRAEDRL